MKTFGMAMLAAFVLLAMGPGRTEAATADGTLITNVACATFSSAQTAGQGYAVSYCATATVLIQNPCVQLQKVANPTVQASGGSVTFTLWVVNCSATSSAWNVTVTDKMPDNTAYAGGTFLSWPGLSSGFSWLPSYSTNNTTWSGTPLQPADGTVVPLYLRYVLEALGPSRSAFARFSVEIL